MATVHQIVESKSLYCPHCQGTHLHTQGNKGEWKCMFCKQIHEHEGSPARTERKALG